MVPDMYSILILGSCVTRDIFNFNEASNYKIIDYFARTSFASLYSPHIEYKLELNDLTSTFQNKIVRCDLDKIFKKYLRVGECDLLIIDLIDERFDLFEFKNGSIITLSNELVASGFNHESFDGKVIKSSSPEFIEIWQRSWNDFVYDMRKIGQFHKVRLHKSFWSLKDEHDKPLGIYTVKVIEDSNNFLMKLYSIAEKDLERLQILEADSSFLKVPLNHKWGLSPFHFIDEYYLSILSQLESDLVGLVDNPVKGECQPHA